MHCPFCNGEDTKVIDSRHAIDTNTVRRRRACSQCNERFTTYEMVELTMPRVVKRDETRVAFDEGKVREGILRALEKRPVSADEVERALSSIFRKVRSTGEREISTEKIGQLVMEELKSLDHVAYVRFASVYRRFKDLDEFKDEIERLIR